LNDEILAKIFWNLLQFYNKILLKTMELRMGLSPNEAQEAYVLLAEIALKSGLRWLIDDVESQIYSGKQITKKIQIEITDYHPDKYSSEKRKGRTAGFIVSEPYNENEKLHLLVDAIEAASCGLSNAVLMTFDFLEHKIRNLTSLEFTPDIKIGKGFKVERDFIYQKEKIEHLSKLLNELRKAI
jgi:hypothetical protein